MSQHRYPIATLYADYGRVAFGLAVTLGPLLLLDLARPVTMLLAALAALFVWFGWRTVLRQVSCVEVSSDAILLRGPWQRRLPWQQLSRLKLAYYAPRRGRDNGWLQLTLRGAAQRSLRVDSTLDDFDHVLRRAVDAAAAKTLPLDPTTLSNLQALGIHPDSSADTERDGDVSVGPSIPPHTAPQDTAPTHTAMPPSKSKPERST